MTNDDKNKKQSGEKPGDSRWWEFYVVRYAMGTVIGAIVFYFLCKNVPALNPLLFDIATNPDSKSVAVKIEPEKLALLATYGLVYCYIASAPILVFHAGRFLLKFNSANYVWFKRCCYYCVLPLAASAVIFYLSNGVDRWIFALASFFFTLIVELQFAFAFFSLWKNKEMFEFYIKLAEKRKNAEGGITDSYRHLREHGNSFFIVFLEILLGTILIGVSNVVPPIPTSSLDAKVVVALLMLTVWILPAVLVWIIGTLFERQFSGIDSP